MLSRLRNKLLAWFLIFSSLSILFMFATWYVIQKEKNYREIIEHIQDYEKNFYRDINAVSNFLYYETIDTSFYATGKSSYLQMHNHLNKKRNDGFLKLSEMAELNQFALKENMHEIENELSRYDSLIGIIAQKTFVRGFKDYGLVGEMRENAHLLENYSHFVNPTLLLNMRRREKDYLIRYEQAYVVQFREIGNKLNHTINSKTNISRSVRKVLNDALFNYMNLFDRVVFLDREIGAKYPGGLMQNLKRTENKSKQYFSLLVDQTTRKKDALSRQLQVYFVFFSVVLILLSVAISILVSKKITDPLRQLSSYMSDFIASGFQPKKDYKPLKDKNEVGRLSRNFSVLKNEIEDNIRHFKEKVEERTAEIMFQKDKIETQKAEIQVQRDTLERTNNTMEKQKEVLEHQNKSIISSIKYAQRIQKALFSDLKTIRSVWEDTFVFIQPKDIVSGDFYFIDKVRYSASTQIVFTAIDCTGHGVPGALMSILSYNSLKQTIKELRHTNPLYVATYMNSFIYDALHSNRQNHYVNDGLDMSYAVFHPEKMLLEYIGVQMPLYIIRKGELIEYKGSKIMLGSDPEVPQDLKKQTIQLQKNDMVYMFSDGFPDQFGGTSGKKFKKKQFKQLLMAISEDSIDNQRQELNETFNDWRGNYDQVDDVLVIGFRV